MWHKCCVVCTSEFTLSEYIFQYTSEHLKSIIKTTQNFTKCLPTTITSHMLMSATTEKFSSTLYLPTEVSIAFLITYVWNGHSFNPFRNAINYMKSNATTIAGHGTIHTHAELQPVWLGIGYVSGQRVGARLQLKFNWRRVDCDLILLPAHLT